MCGLENKVKTIGNQENPNYKQEAEDRPGACLFLKEKDCYHHGNPNYYYKHRGYGHILYVPLIFIFLPIKCFDSIPCGRNFVKVLAFIFICK